jgi:hypothetical protein
MTTIMSIIMITIMTTTTIMSIIMITPTDTTTPLWLTLQPSLVG